jgi:MFS family permease
VPVPLLLIWAPTWSWVVAANVLLGISQGLTWSTTVIMKIDLVGPARRGLAMGFNEAAGYGAVALTALATGYLAARYGLRPEPFYIGIAYAALGLGLSTLAVRETRDHARLEAGSHTARADGRHTHLHGGLTDRQVFAETSLREPALSAASQAGLVNNLNDGLAWGLVPLYLAAHGASVGDIALVAALYPGVWSVAQIGTGYWSDRIGRKPLIVAGMLTQSGALALLAVGNGAVPTAALAAVLLGAGTALVYPTLIAAMSDAVTPVARAPVVGVYRFWRDSGYALGGIIAGTIADALGYGGAIAIVAGLTAASGLWVLYDLPALRQPPRVGPRRRHPQRGVVARQQTLRPPTNP